MAKDSFEWDLRKDSLNQIKHGVAFVEAQYAFADFSRIIARDLSHGGDEDRFYCFGKVTRGILTVRFTYRDKLIRIFGAGFWRKGKKNMSTKTQYSNEPLGSLKVIEDFLPSPEQLAFNEETVKVTISLSKDSVDFFKAEAKKHNTQYQRMIRRLLDSYTQSHRQS